MDERDFDADLQAVARRVAYLSSQVGVDVGHKARLRADLLARHAEVTGRRRFRLPTFKRTFSLTAPALAVAVVLALLLPDVHLGGKPSTASAEAARIAMAAARTVPTVTSWQVTLHRIQGDTATSTDCYVPLPPGERLYTRDGAIYVYYRNSWYRVTTSGSGSCARWRYEFLSLPAALLHQKVAIGRSTTVDGQPVEEVSYATRRHSEMIAVRAWVSPTTGLVV